MFFKKSSNKVYFISYVYSLLHICFSSFYCLVSVQCNFFIGFGCFDLSSPNQNLAMTGYCINRSSSTNLWRVTHTTINFPIFFHSFSCRQSQFAHRIHLCIMSWELLPIIWKSKDIFLIYVIRLNNIFSISSLKIKLWTIRQVFVEPIKSLLCIKIKQNIVLFSILFSLSSSHFLS